MAMTDAEGGLIVLPGVLCAGGIPLQTQAQSVYICVSLWRLVCRPWMPEQVSERSGAIAEVGRLGKTES
jgi:hypothetical protein